MRYYIRRGKDGDIQGPFTVAELVAEIGTKSVSQDSHASSDISETIERLRKYRACDWFPLSHIPELQHLFPPPQPEVLVPRPVTMTSVILLLFFASQARHQWFAWLLVVAALAMAVEFVMRFVREKRQQAS